MQQLLKDETLEGLGPDSFTLSEGVRSHNHAECPLIAHVWGQEALRAPDRYATGA